MSEATPSKKRSRIGLVTAVFAVLLVLLAVAAALVWIFRANIVEMAISRQCDQSGLFCEADVETVGLNRADITSVQITSGGRELLVTGPISAEYSWPNWFQPKLDRASVQQPVLRAGFDGSQFNLFGLERLASGGGEGSPALITIEGGRVLLETPAGEVEAMVNVAGELPSSGDATITISSADLQSGGDRLSLSGSSALLTLKDGQVSGSANMAIRDALLGDLEIQQADFSAQLSGSDAAPTIVWNGTAGAIKLAERSFSGVETTGQAKLASLPDGGLSSAISALTDAGGEFSASSINLGGIASGPINLTAEIERNGDQFSGPVNFRAESLSFLTGIARELSATGQVSMDATTLNEISFVGSSIVKGAGIHSQRRSEWLTSVRFPEPYGAHGDELRGALSSALSDFDTGADIKFLRAGNDWQLKTDRATAITSASGMTISVEPIFGPDWLILSGDEASLSGEFVISGGGGPDIDAVLRSAFYTPDALSIDAETLKIAPWSVDGRSLSVSLTPFSMASTASGLRVGTRGEVTTSGAFPGADLKATSLVGGFEASRGPEGWRVQTERGACVDLSSGGLRSGGIRLKPVDLNICPEDGRFVREEGGAPTGKLLLGDVTVPFESAGSSGTLQLEKSSLDWSLDNGLRAAIVGDALAMPLELSSGSLRIDGEMPRLSVVAGAGPIQIFASLEESSFSGGLIPANVSAEGFSFSGRVGEAGLEGTLRSENVRIQDDRADPLYQPLRADLTANLKDGFFSMSGPLRLQQSGWTIADSQLDLELGSLNGTAELIGRTLTFVPGGLQPHDLSDQLRSALPNARGTIVSNADFEITNGKLSGTGDVTVQDLSFDTFRIGSVSGVSGEIKFADIIELTTFPQQKVTIDRVDPGVQLDNGQLAFQLTGGRNLLLQSAIWPFAGGELSIAPTSWEIGGSTELISITADKIELAELMEALSLEKEFKANGTVSGTFPIEIVGPNAFIRNATFKADQTGGLLAYLGQGLDAAKGQSEASDYALEALKDFRFKVLEMRANGNITGWIELGILLEGTSPEVLDGAPFRFDMTVDSKLAQLIRSLKTRADPGSFVDYLFYEAEGPDISEVPQ